MCTKSIIIGAVGAVALIYVIKLAKGHDMKSALTTII